MRWGVLGILFVAAPVSAQSVDTTCTQTGMFTNCNSTYSPPPGQGFAEGMASLGRALAERRQRRLDRQAAEIEQQFNMRISELVQAGDCDSANQLAIKFGRYDVVNAIGQACRQMSQARTTPSYPAPRGAPLYSNVPLCNQQPRPDPCQPG